MHYGPAAGEHIISITYRHADNANDGMYFGGRLLARWDRLGSVPRATPTGSIAYFPWARRRNSRPCIPTPTATTNTRLLPRWHNNGAGQDYANARYYNNNFR